MWVSCQWRPVPVGEGGGEGGAVVVGERDEFDSGVKEMPTQLGTETVESLRVVVRGI